MVRKMRKNRRGGLNWVGMTVLVVLSLALSLILVQAEGAPSTPGVVLSGTLSPTAAQTIQVTFTDTMYAIQPVNSVLNFGTAIVYSALVNNITTVAFHQKTATSVISSNGTLYTLQATVSVSIPQLCTGAACSGFIEDLVITAYATTSTWIGFWQSGSVTVSFLSSSAAKAVFPGVAPTGQFLYETIGMATIFGALFIFVVGLMGIRPTEMLVMGGILTLGFAAELLVWMIR